MTYHQYKYLSKITDLSYLCIALVDAPLSKKWRTLDDVFNEIALDPIMLHNPRTVDGWLQADPITFVIHIPHRMQVQSVVLFDGTGKRKLLAAVDEGFNLPCSTYGIFGRLRLLSIEFGPRGIWGWPKDAAYLKQVEQKR